MVSIVIDTITIAEHLQEAGMEEKVAKAVAKEVAVNHGEVATKEDLVTLKGEFKEGMVVLKEYVDQRFTSADEKIDQRFTSADEKIDQRFTSADEKADLRFAAVDQRFVGVDQRLDSMHAEMIRGFKSMRWFIGILSGAIGIVISVIMIVF